MSEKTTADIRNRMEDCGDGRHVGWWMEYYGLVEKALLVEIMPMSVLLSCCEDDDTRISFVTDHAKAKEIVRAWAKALGMTVE
jgi:hypothetical protein